MSDTPQVRLVAVALLVSILSSGALLAAQDRSEGKYGWGDGLVVELTPEEGSAATPAPSRAD